MTTIHCGNKFAIQNVFKTLFITTATKPSTTAAAVGRRKLSTAVSSQSTIPQKVHDYNRILKSHALKFKKNDTAQKKAIEILKEMKGKGFQPTSQTYLQLVMGLSLQRHRTNIQNERLEAWFNELVELERNKKRKKATVDKLSKVFFYLSLQGHPNVKDMFLKISTDYHLDIECWHMAMKGCIKAKKMTDAEELLNIIREKGTATMASYQILIQSYLFLKDLTSASRIFSLMLNDQVTADYHTYKLFINYYMELPFTMEIAETLNRLWQAVLMTTTQENIPDDMIQKFISYFGRHKQLSKAEQIYLDVKSRKEQKLSRRCIGEMNKVIIGFSNKKQLPSALSLYYDLIGSGYKPSQHIINKITEACKVKNDVEAIQQLIDITLELNPDAKIAQTSDNALLLDYPKRK